MANSLLKRVLGEAEALVEPWQKQALSDIRKRFIRERVTGFTTQEGQHFAPISQADAEAKWAAAESKFVAALVNLEPKAVERFKRDYEYRQIPAPRRRTEVSTPSPQAEERREVQIAKRMKTLANQVAAYTPTARAEGRAIADEIETLADELIQMHQRS